MKDCEDCCRNCCYSTPLFTLSTICFIGLGITGFALSGLYGVAKMDTFPHIQNGTSVMAPVVCGAILITIIPVVLVSIMSYCVTGYIRDILFKSYIKSCIGSGCINISLMVMLLVFILLWLVLAIGLGGIMAYYLQIHRFCSQRGTEGMTLDAGSAYTCLYYVDSGLDFFPICDSLELDMICSSDGLSVGTAFSIALIFAVLVVMGLVTLSIVHMYNYVSARDHIDCRETTRNEYDLKKVH